MQQIYKQIQKHLEDKDMQEEMKKQERQQTLERQEKTKLEYLKVTLSQISLSPSFWHCDNDHSHLRYVDFKGAEVQCWCLRSI